MQGTGGYGSDGIIGAYIDSSTYLPYIGPSGVTLSLAAYAPSSSIYNVPYIMSFINSADPSLNALTLNGTPLTLEYSQPADSYNTSSMSYIIGNANYGTNVDVMEIIFYYGDLSRSQRQRVEGYLAWKWGLQTTLPSSHPYYKIRP
jgi:hypothetical protein